jgi:DNA mismatch repair protein MutL
MADKINLLPETVANQIAAGEVVQRPSSVVKELLENAIDAGSTRVNLIIKEGGIQLIQVVDNGCGMSHTDARMCWERHATSKINKSEDLYRIKTFGFRGEALASIASVAQVEMTTKMAENDLGTKILIEGGHIKKHEFTGSQNGTSIAVKNLFYNVPARRNFLKSISVETRHIMDEFTRTALVHADVAFNFYNNDKLVLELPVSDAKTRVVNLMGRVKHSELLDINEDTDIVKISGYVGKPEVAKKTRGEQFLYVNNRFIKDPYLNHAIRTGYQNLISNDSHPFYIVFLQIDPSRIDVNVHPSKTEIKFEDEKPIYALLNAAIKRTLGGLLMMPEMEETFFPKFNPANPPSVTPGYSPEPKVNKNFNPFDQSYERPKNAGGWEKLFDPFKADPQSKNQSVNISQDLFQQSVVNPAFNVETVFQIEDVLVAKVDAEMYLVNIFLARERIWYERYLNNLEKRQASTQQLLFPKTLVFSVLDAEILNEMIDAIKCLGFDIGSFGNNSFILNGLPADLPRGNEQKILEGLLENFKENRAKHTLNEKENLARSMAKNAAMFAAKILGSQDRTNLLNELLSCQFPKYCPFGRPVFAKVPREEMNKLFKI